MKIAGVEISHPDKIIFPQISKQDMLEYYESVADYMLPFLKDRPLTLQRCPNGINEDGFYQKKAGDYFPDYIQRIKIETREGQQEQVICNSKKSLIYLVNQGTVSFHVWLSRKDKLHHPDKVVYDLDPPKGSFVHMKEAARKLKDFLNDQDIQVKLMTTGKGGLHLYYSKRRTRDFDDVREEARNYAEEMVELYPDLFTIETLKKKREGKIFLDYLRNAYAQTAVCPYSLRPIASAGIATPIDWSELSRLKAGDHYHLGNIFRRLSQK